MSDFVERCVPTGECQCACHGSFGMAVKHFAPCCYPELAVADDVLPGDSDRCESCARVLPCTGSCPHCDWEEDR
jgi:hypothetical protein